MSIRRGPGRRRLAGILAGALALAACSAGDSPLDRSEDATTAPTAPASTAEGGVPVDARQVLRLGLVGLGPFDPIVADPVDPSTSIIADLLYDTLTELDDVTGEARPGLATFAPNEDLTAWRFTLDPSATFADGSPITAADVVNALDRLRAMNPPTLASLALEDIRAVAAVDAATVDVALTRPSALLPELLSTPATGILDADGSLNPSGDYSATIAGTGLLLDRRRGDGPESIVVQRFEDVSRAYAAFAAGEVDWAPVAADRLGEVLDANDPVELSPFHATVVLGLNGGVAPLDQIGLRRAISLGIDRTALADVVFGPSARPARGLVPFGTPGTTETCVGPCGPDRTRAAALARGTFPEGQAVPLRLITDGTETQATIGRILEQQLAEVGIAVGTSPLDPDTYDQLVASGQQQLFLYSTLGIARTPAGHLAPFASGSVDNLVRYANPLVDEAITAARIEQVASVRAARWAEIEAAILADAPVVPLVQLRSLFATSARIEGLVQRIDGTLDLSKVTFAEG